MRNPFAQPKVHVSGAVAAALPEARLAFIRKVYAALMATITVASAGVAAVLRVPAVAELALAWYWPLLIAELVTVFAVFFLHRRHPLNVALLGLFALLTGLTTGVIVFSYVAAGLADTVVQAAGLTVVAFGSLTGYVLVTKKDFSFLRGFVTVGLFVILGGLILNLFVQAPALNFAISAGGVLLFSAFILYDTSNVLFRYREDEWVGATLALFLDFLNLFLFLLRLLSSDRD